jgi:hypothetical protein
MGGAAGEFDESRGGRVDLQLTGPVGEEGGKVAEAISVTVSAAAAAEGGDLQIVGHGPERWMNAEPRKSGAGTTGGRQAEDQGFELGRRGKRGTGKKAWLCRERVCLPLSMTAEGAPGYAYPGTGAYTFVFSSYRIMHPGASSFFRPRVSKSRTGTLT